MAIGKDMTRRKALRQLEAKRDLLMTRIKKDRITLAEVRAAMKIMRRS